MEDQIWSARDRTVVAKIEQYLEESYSMKVEVEELKKHVFPSCKLPDWQGITKAKRSSKFCRQGEEEVCIASFARWTHATEVSGGTGEAMSRYDAGSETIERKDKKF